MVIGQMEKDLQKNNKDNYLQVVFDSHIFYVQVDDEYSMPLVEIETFNFNDVVGSLLGLEIPPNLEIIGYNLNGSSKRSERNSKPTLQSTVTKGDKYTYSKREAKYLMDRNVDGKYEAIKEDTKNTKKRYYLQNLKCKNTFLDLAKLSKG